MNAEVDVDVSREATRRAVSRGRVDAVDLARAVALVGMAAYHFSWDLAYFKLAPAGLPFSPAMRLFSHVIASGFLLLVGVSLALAHRRGFALRAFGRRLAVVAGAAVLVTLASAIFAPSETIVFGILHCIAAASLLALPFLAAPPIVGVAAGLAAFAAPSFVHAAVFDPPALLWIGLGDVEPSTLDWRPLLPWGGMALIGLGLARLPPLAALLASPTRWRAASAPTRALTFAGRHSLAVYLLHQPALIGLLYLATTLGGLGSAQNVGDDRAFLAACEKACVSAGRTAGPCEKSCACVADVVKRSGQAERLGAGDLSDAERARLKSLAEACAAP